MKFISARAVRTTGSLENMNTRSMRVDFEPYPRSVTIPDSLLRNKRPVCRRGAPEAGRMRSH